MSHLDGHSSPYLASHAADPVDWRPWGAEAFELARETERPIFLSVGYQSCHWCHVMQRESFRDESVAEKLNRDFVPVKVDRELRPDVDALYMAYIQAATGSGGWPMSVFLTPELLPFFGGTYFPKTSPTPRMPTFFEVLETVGVSWSSSPERAREVGEDALHFVEQQMRPKGPAPWDRTLVDDAARQVLALHDERFGGFGRAPKFPMAPTIEFMLARHEAVADEAALHAAIHTVLSMLRGGIWDQAGGGLFRYSTDGEWLVPHFEKMLYDQGLLLGNLATLVAETQAEEFRRAVCGAAEFLDRDLARPSGGWWSSLDADTNGVEGATYVWTREELAAHLSPEELALAEQRLGVSATGNWEDTTILTRRTGRHGDAAEVDALLERVLEARAGRPQPDVVTNALVGWNAIVARGLIEAGAAIEDDRLVDRGLEVVDLLLSSSVDGDAVRHTLDETGEGNALLLEDHAALVAACLSAAAADRDELTARAGELHAATVSRFAIPGDGGRPQGFAMTTAGELPLRPLEQADSPSPAGASIVAENEIRLARMVDREPSEAITSATERQMADTARVAPHLAGHVLAQACRRLSR